MGPELVDRLLAGGRVALIDSAGGRPDIAVLVAAHLESVEAVFVVSNPAVRDHVAAVCDRLGVPWYGPTFDS